MEVNDIKNSFERGETVTWPTASGGLGWGLTLSAHRAGNDPLIDEESNHDINSVAGVLKLYFRGLENPLFPKERFNDLISCVRECPPSYSADITLCQRVSVLAAIFIFSPVSNVYLSLIKLTKSLSI